MTFTRAEVLNLTSHVAAVAGRVDDFDGMDPYESAMRYWFAIADTLHLRGVEIPAQWEYQPGAGGVDTDNPDLDEVAEWSDAYLRVMGDRCERLADICTHFGLDY